MRSTTLMMRTKVMIGLRQDFVVKTSLLVDLTAKKGRFKDRGIPLKLPSTGSSKETKHGTTKPTTKENVEPKSKPKAQIEAKPKRERLKLRLKQAESIGIDSDETRSYAAENSDS